MKFKLSDEMPVKSRLRGYGGMIFLFWVQWLAPKLTMEGISCLLY